MPRNGGSIPPASTTDRRGNPLRRDRPAGRHQRVVASNATSRGEAEAWSKWRRVEAPKAVGLAEEMTRRQMCLASLEYSPGILLFRRLESLPQATGRFRLNVVLPIPFDGRGLMEVDLLDAASRLVVELDGAQHLADADAYRQDRRKDLLLQENGYAVLRFLAEDVGTHLNDVLDTILRALANRQRAVSQTQGTGDPRG